MGVLAILSVFLLLTQAAMAGEQDGIRETVVSPAEFMGAMKGVEASEMDYRAFLKMQARENKPVILDVRSEQAFEREHIKGSINLPLTDMTEKTLAEAIPDKTKDIVVVCDFSLYPSRMLPMTMQAYPVLKVNGYEKIHRLNLWKNDPAGKQSGVVFERAPEPLPVKKVMVYDCEPQGFTMTQEDTGVSLKGKFATPNRYYFHYSVTDVIKIETPVAYLLDADLTIPGELEISGFISGEAQPSYTLPVVKEYKGSPDKIVCTAR